MAQEDDRLQFLYYSLFLQSLRWETERSDMISDAPIEAQDTQVGLRAAYPLL